jgi:hypothetical protein
MDLPATRDQKTARPVHVSNDGRTALFSCGRLRILKLQGSGEERARNHGRLAGQHAHLSKDVLNYFTQKSLAPVKALPFPLRQLGEKALRSWLKSLHQGAPSELRTELTALADGAGIRHDDIIAAASGPDLGNASNAWLLNPLVGWASLRFGCTTLCGRNRGGDFVLARNLDFPGVGCFDKHPLLTVHLPEREGELKTISIASDLVHFSMISAINEAGIGFVVHQNFHRSLAAKSVPLIFVGDLMLRTSRSVQEAVAVLRAHPPGPLWTFVVFDLKSGESCAVEACAESFGVRMADHESGWLSQTNHCLTAPVSSLQYSPLGRLRNSCQRLEYARELLGDFSQLDDLLPVFARALAAKGPLAQGIELDIHESIIKPMTIQSMIFERRSDSKGLGRIWVSRDEAPAPSGDFVGLDIDELFASATTIAPDFEVRRFSDISEEERLYQKNLAHASRLSFDEGRDEEALELLKECGSPGMLLARAVLSARCGRFGDSDRLAERALTFKVPSHIRESLKWVRCVALYEQGHVQAARDLARDLTDHGLQNATLSKAAERLARGLKLRAHERNLIFDFFSGDLATLPQAPD